VTPEDAEALRAVLDRQSPAGSSVAVTPMPDGANVFIEYPDGYVQVVTGDEPGPVLRLMLARNLLADDPEDE
jgi:hypothetical protein